MFGVVEVVLLLSVVEKKGDKGKERERERTILLRT